MIFRRKRTADEGREDVDDVSFDDEVDGEETEDEWSSYDDEDWRDDGPFDIDEVDLEADEVVRLDLGALVLTPFEGMNLQLQINEETKEVQTLLVSTDDSALELALFAAPTQTSIVGDIRREMLEEAEASGGTAKLVEGPFGVEIRRSVPVTGPKGERLMHVSRTWFAQGPRWLLRGVLVGKAGQATGTDGPTLALYECFANAVVRRGDKPLAAGDLITMTLPEGVGQ